MILVASTFAQVLSRSGPGVNVIGVLVVWRFIMGMGTGMGGDNSLGAVIGSEFASTGRRGRLMMTVFTAQGWGNIGTQHHSCVEACVAQLVLAASLVELVTIHAYKASIVADSFDELRHVDYCWRTLIGLGSVPGAIALYLRFTIPETSRFRMDIDRDVQRARADIGNVLGHNGTPAAVYWVDQDAVVEREEAPHRCRSDVIKYFAQRYDFLLLFGLSYSWFAVDASPISFIRQHYELICIVINRSLSVASVSIRRF